MPAGIDPSMFSHLLSDPELMQAFSDPAMMEKMKDIMSNPGNISKYQDDPAIMKLMSKVGGAFGGGGMPGGGMPEGGGMPGGGYGGAGGSAPAPNAGPTFEEVDEAAPGAAAAAAPAAAVPVSTGTWGTEHTYTIGPEGNEHIFDGKAVLLDRAAYSSVMSVCQQLNDGAVAGMEIGYCVLFSASKQKYFLLWRSDREYEAFTALGIQDEESSPWWTVDQAKDLGGPGTCEHMFAEGRAQLLDTSVYSSCTQTVDALNARQVDAPAGYCVIFSQSQQSYFLLWRSGKDAEGFAALGIAA